MDVTNVVADNVKAIREQKKLTLDAAAELILIGEKVYLRDRQHLVLESNDNSSACQRTPVFKR